MKYNKKDEGILIFFLSIFTALALTFTCQPESATHNHYVEGEVIIKPISGLQASAIGRVKKSIDKLKGTGYF